MCGKRDLTDRTDVDLLLRAFYGRAMEDPLLRPVFVDVAHLDLEEHLPRIGAFWEFVLFATGSYSGRPMQVHRALAARSPLGQAHFNRWLELWTRTVDELFAGPVAEAATVHAGRIATAMLRQLDPVGAGVVPPAELPLVPIDGGGRASPAHDVLSPPLLEATLPATAELARPSEVERG